MVSLKLRRQKGVHQDVVGHVHFLLVAGGETHPALEPRESATRRQKSKWTNDDGHDFESPKPFQIGTERTSTFADPLLVVDVNHDASVDNVTDVVGE